ncbi:MAG: hypothetical protein J5I98_17380 [Phaeodactylibacter sp.]|nr:hypothetical protein [Phaeodactylibacter sp.]
MKALRDRRQLLFNLLEDKFGAAICQHLISEDTSLNFNNRVPKGQGKEEVSRQFRPLIDRRVIDESFYQKFEEEGWAFDFPGWIGRIGDHSERIRDIMIIQAEPHVENYDYQYVYEFAERKYYSDFSIRGSKIKSNSIRDIWTRTVHFLADDDTRSKIFNQQDKKALYHVLERIYITDVCHFAPQVSVERLEKERQWGKVREKAARAFLVREITAVNPRLIIAAGNSSVQAIKDYLLPEFDSNSKVILNANDVPGRGIKGLPLLYELYKNGTFVSYLLCAPHLGFDGYSAGTFWKENGRILHDKMKKVMRNGWL